jgi:hypothetical protein
MTLRHVHYEAAFEDYLRTQGIPYVPVDEHKKAVFAGARIKSFDFLVYRPGQPTWLADIKGRKFPYDTPANRRTWENWVTDEDIAGLGQWESVFGGGFKGMFVFAYWLTDEENPKLLERSHPYRHEHYAFLCVSLAEYRAAAKRRSPKWGTVTVPASIFRRLAVPIQEA